MLSTLSLLAAASLSAAPVSMADEGICALTPPEAASAPETLASPPLSVSPAGSRPDWCTDRDSLADPRCSPEGQGHIPGQTPFGPEFRFDPAATVDLTVPTSFLEGPALERDAPDGGRTFGARLDRPPRA